MKPQVITGFDEVAKVLSKASQAPVSRADVYRYAMSSRDALPVSFVGDTVVGVIAGLERWAEKNIRKAVAEPIVIFPRRIDESFVYFIAAETGQIKIGVSCEVKKRLATLQTASPVRLSLLMVLRGGYELEAELHKRFSNFRRNGEWFEPSAEILNYIESQAPCKVSQ